MKNNYLFMTVAVVFGLLLASVWSPLVTAELPVATGEQWTTATEREKKAFLFGFATMAKLEQEAHGENPPPEVKKLSFVPTLLEGLSHYTITSAMNAIDAWYAAHPDQLQRPVVEVIWFDLVLPKVKSE